MKERQHLFIGFILLFHMYRYINEREIPIFSETTQIKQRESGYVLGSKWIESVNANYH